MLTFVSACTAFCSSSSAVDSARFARIMSGI
jgi:hypothetical protein